MGRPHACSPSIACALRAPRGSADARPEPVTSADDPSPVVVMVVVWEGAALGSHSGHDSTTMLPGTYVSPWTLQLLAPGLGVPPPCSVMPAWEWWAWRRAGSGIKTRSCNAV